MITATEIQTKAQRLYTDYLESVVTGEAFFPCSIRSNKQVSHDFPTMQKEIAEVAARSTDRKGYGYTVFYEPIQTRRHGIQNLPAGIAFENERNYLTFIGKGQEAEVFKKDVALICHVIPALKDWCPKQVRLILDEAGEWPDLLKVCTYFVSHPRPELYIRELPIEVHTKFIEQHARVLQSLLYFLLPEIDVRREGKTFCSRFYLKESEPLVRFRLLESTISHNHFAEINDLSIPISQFRRLTPHCDTIFIVENQMNCLTFPSVPNAMAIWGKGFQVELLKDCLWLKERPITYWGDMDVHGFQILSQVRSYFPQTKSLMMDFRTFEAFNSMAVANQVSVPPVLHYLTPEEEMLFQHLKKHSLRLEQEKISQAYTLEFLKSERFSVPLPL